MFKGSNPALITPFRNGEVDEEAFTRLIDWQIAEGSHGLVPCGTTGESPTLTHAEHKRVVELCIKQADGRVPVMAGAGSNSTAEAAELVAHAKSAGATAALVVTPYYNKPTQEGLYRHYMTLAEIGLPIFIYNIPGRSVVDMSVETMARLAKHDMIAGVKDATADLARPSLTRQACGKDFIMLSGEDATALGFNAHGGLGCISVTANIAPRLCAQFQEATLAGDYAKALEIQDKLMPVHMSMFVEANPGPVKYAASRLGLCGEDTRLPLVPVSDATRKTVDTALQSAGLKALEVAGAA